MFIETVVFPSPFQHLLTPLNGSLHCTHPVLASPHLCFHLFSHHLLTFCLLSSRSAHLSLTSPWLSEFVELVKKWFSQLRERNGTCLTRLTQITLPTFLLSSKFKLCSYVIPSLFENLTLQSNIDLYSLSRGSATRRRHQTHLDQYT